MERLAHKGTKNLSLLACHTRLCKRLQVGGRLGQLCADLERDRCVRIRFLDLFVALTSTDELNKARPAVPSNVFSTAIAAHDAAASQRNTSLSSCNDLDNHEERQLRIPKSFCALSAQPARGSNTRARSPAYLSERSIRWISRSPASVTTGTPHNLHRSCTDQRAKPGTTPSHSMGLALTQSAAMVVALPDQLMRAECAHYQRSVTPCEGSYMQRIAHLHRCGKPVMQ